MKNNSSVSTLQQIIGLLLVLGVAYGSEVLVDILRTRNPVTANLNYVVLGAYAVTALQVVGAMLLLFWAVIKQSHRILWIGILFLVIGLLIVLAPILYFTPVLGWISRFYPQSLFPRSIFYYSGG